jgi:hypothetical protein
VPVLHRELRLFAIVVVIVVAYGAAVTTAAARLDQLGQFRGGALSTSLTLVLVLGLGGAVAAYALDLLAVRRPRLVLATIWSDVRTHLLSLPHLVARSTVLIAWFVMMLFFSVQKRLLPHIVPFQHDETFARLDRLLALGVDPWRITHALFGGIWPTYVLQVAYNLWFFLMWLSILYVLLRLDRFEVRARYLIAFPLCWILVGSAAATAMSSAGPCYQALLGVGDTFEPLMARLLAIDADLQAHGLGLTALSVQDMLWRGYIADGRLFGGGITAMPSMHVALAVLMACAARQLDRRLGRAFAAYATVIWIGSIHLGWHYALDGIVALPLTLAIWRFSGWLVDRYVMREAPAAVWRPALAE